MSSVSRGEFSSFRRVVVKVGTGVVTTEDGYVSSGRVGTLVEQLWRLTKRGVEVVLVTSGSVGLGRKKLSTQSMLSSSLREHMHRGAGQQPECDEKAAAACGQSVLMSIYESLFSQLDVKCSQVLVMDEDFQAEKKRMQFRSTMEAMLKVGILPILNENDVMSSRVTPLVDENQAIFWDNDSLACLVGAEIGADLIILLTDVDGLYEKPPSESEMPTVISTFQVSSNFAFGVKSRVGRGGMQAKVDAALSAIRKGVKAVVIANGFKGDTVKRIINGENVGTLFAPQSINENFHEVSLKDQASGVRNASRNLINESSTCRNEILREIASVLVSKADEIIKINQVDIAKNPGLSAQNKARLILTRQKIKTLADGILSIAASEEQIHRIIKRTEVSKNLVLELQTVPIGVLLIIFESRPDAFPQIAALSIKSGNGLLVKGGKEASYTNRFLHELITSTISRVTEGRIGKELIVLVESRDSISELLKLDKFIDLVIPRGSNQMVSSIKAKTKIPVLGHAEGICHVYIDKEASVTNAIEIIIDSKTDYPAACNAVETVLFHDSFATTHGQQVMKALHDANIECFGDFEASKLFRIPPVKSFKQEYGRNALSIAIVPDLNDAISHITKYGSGHTDVIITENQEVAERFLRNVDSACVFHNASSRFSDGYRFGLGAEVGISTGRIHSRGPVGVEGLLTNKWTLRSISGVQAVKPFHLGQAEYTHKNLPIQVKAQL